jgi:Mn-dependent DtxR family transcriptional regulator
MNSLDGLTPRQREVLRLIHWTLSATGRAPTLDRIAGALRVSRERARQHVERLERAGLVAREGRRPMRLTEAGASWGGNEG